jgi:hypothetical protein
VAGGGDGKKERNGGAHIWRGKWRASRNGGWEGEFGGASKMEGHLEVLLELCFFTKPLKFGVEAHMEAPTGVALRPGYCRALLKVIKYLLLYAKHLTM